MSIELRGRSDDREHRQAHQELTTSRGVLDRRHEPLAVGGRQPTAGDEVVGEALHREATKRRRRLGRGPRSSRSASPRFSQAERSQRRRRGRAVAGRRWTGDVRSVRIPSRTSAASLSSPTSIVNVDQSVSIRETRPPGRTTRTISATAAAGSASHWSVRSDRAASKESSGSSREHASPTVKRTRQRARSGVGTGDAQHALGGVDADDLSAFAEILGERERCLPECRSQRRAVVRQERGRDVLAPTIAAGVSRPIRRFRPWQRGARRRSDQHRPAGSRACACPPSPCRERT